MREKSLSEYFSEVQSTRDHRFVMLEDTYVGPLLLPEKVLAEKKIIIKRNNCETASLGLKKNRSCYEKRRKQ